MGWHTRDNGKIEGVMKWQNEGVRCVKEGCEEMRC